MYSGAQQHGILFVRILTRHALSHHPTGTAEEAVILVLTFGASIALFKDQFTIRSLLLASFRTSPQCISPRIMIGSLLLGRPNLRILFSLWRQEKGELETHLLAKGAGNTKCDVSPLTQLAFAKGTVLGTCGGSTRDNTCTDARKPELNVSNMLRADDQQNQGAMSNHQIGCATSTRSLTSCPQSSRPWRPLLHFLPCHR